MMFRARVYGLPVAQGRPKFVRATGHAYDPAKSVDWKRTVYAQVLPVRPASLLQGPLEMRLVFVLLKPPSVSKRREWPEVKPDADNLCKAVKDALRGLVYRDDAQIVHLDVWKEYGADPGVDIEVRDAQRRAS